MGGREMKKALEGTVIFILMITLTFGTVMLAGSAAAHLSAPNGTGSQSVFVHPTPDPHP
jgi:hypothetical protein